MDSVYDEDYPTCKGCGSFTSEPYIKCAECSSESETIVVCLHCFSNGVEFQQHQNNHDYIVVKHDFPVISEDWTAAEEIKLLNSLLECGLGNWPAISRVVGSKSSEECRSHYLTHYIENPKSPLPQLPTPAYDCFPTPVVYIPGEEPPRPAEGSSLQVDMSGYNAARGDFMTEYKNHAELSLTELEFSNEDSELETDLKLAVIDVYLHILRERHQRKKLIRNYGLIQTRRVLLWQRRYHATLGVEMVEGLRALMRLLPCEEWCKFLEALSLEASLRKEILCLKKWRQEGIQYFRSGNIYEMLKEKRKCFRPQLEQDIVHSIKTEWISRPSAPVVAPTVKVPSLPRKQSLPLEIEGLPKYEKLTEDEKKLCSSLRFLPGSFLDYKETLMNESKKCGGLRLKNARAVLKIDVNKTRKLFNFLGECGYIDIIK